jgi:dCMP deaminase
MSTRPDWDLYFLSIARAVSARATCPRKHVGAIVVRDRHILTTGYNGSLPGQPHCEDESCLMEDGHCGFVTYDEVLAAENRFQSALAVAMAAFTETVQAKEHV